MKSLTVIGHLGADAEVRRENGAEFVSISIADTKRRLGADGKVTESTTWISATIRVVPERLLPYLKKGQLVVAIGDMDVRTYHSEKQRRLVAGINMYVRRIDLLGAKPNAVPSTLYDSDGVAHSVGQFFYCDSFKVGQLFTSSGGVYSVTDGWVVPMVPEAQVKIEAPVDADQSQSEAAAQPASQIADSSPNPASDGGKKGKSSKS